ncbi:MAG: glycosyltransferase family 9 protein [Desulfovibrionaceae bacterium]|nr:glycosyltransferase family 9 protein [Desulfovibrionaceae bacterium]
MNILLVNLTRFGDLLQSQAAINALASLNLPTGEKDNPVGLVCLHNFASGAEFLRKLALIRPLPKDAFLGRLEENWREAGADLWQWREELRRDFKPDLVCNLTPSVPGRLLGRFLAEEAPLTGFGMNEFGFGTASPWAAFFQGSSRRRSVCPFNVADLFRAVAGQTQGEAGDTRLRLPEKARLGPALKKRLTHARAQAAGLVAFQLGASEERRRWPEEYFAALGQGLWERHRMLPMLLGNAEEKPLAERYATLARAPSLDLTGETNLEELAMALQETRLLVSNDTGTMHLAAGLGCPVLGLFLATAQAWDTGPGQAESCCLEPGLACHPCAFDADCPHRLRCRRAIPPSTVLRLCSGFLSEGRWPQMQETAIWPEEAGAHFDPRQERPRVWLTSVDGFGFMDLQSLSGHETEPRTVWFREQRLFLRQFLDRDIGKDFQLSDTGKSLLPQPEKGKLAAELSALLAQFALLTELGQMLRRKPLPRLQEGFLQAMRKCSAAFEASPGLTSLSLLWQGEIQEQGEDLEQALVCVTQYHSLISSLLQRVT